MINVLIFNPIWLIKTRLSIQGANPTAKQYKGFVDALITIPKEEGIRGLYRGMVPALFLTSHGAIQFSVYEMMKKLYEKHYNQSQSQSQTQTQQSKQPAIVSIVSGGLSKIIAATITYPYQVIKSRLQHRENLNHYNGTIDCFLKIWRNEGIIGYFRGVVPNALKVAPSAAITFLVYEETLKLLSS